MRPEARRILLFSLLLLSLLLCGFIAGCDAKSVDTAKTAKEIEAQAEKLSKSVTEYVSQVEVPEEVKKLGQFEYDILVVGADIPIDGLKERLNTLGKFRWECFAVEKIKRGDREELTLFLRRRPDTPLKYVPRNLMGPGF